MASIRGNFFRFFLRKTNNLNPVFTPHAVKKIRKLAASSLNDKTPKGFTLSKEKTPNGTLFERVTKDSAAKTGRVIYFLHGGAYISGLLSFYRNFAKDFCDAANGAEMIYLDYHLAPEHLYPTQLNEALDVWDDLTNRQGYLPENIMIAGDSAGANLTLALMLKLRDTGRKMPKAGLCISAWADMTGKGETFSANYGNDIMFGEKGKELTEEARERLIHSEIFCYAGDADRTDPYVSPVYGEYHDFPPMFFAAGGHEMLLSDTLTIVENLKKNAVPVEYDIQPEMFHIYAIYGNFIIEAKESYRKIILFINKQFQPSNHRDSKEVCAVVR